MRTSGLPVKVRASMRPGARMPREADSTTRVPPACGLASMRPGRASTPGATPMRCRAGIDGNALVIIRLSAPVGAYHSIFVSRARATAMLQAATGRHALG